MRWKEPEFTRTQIIKAGKVIKDACCEPEKIEEAMVIIDNWRASHAYPLHVIYCNFRRNYNKKGYIVAERLKRLDSIIKKLEREPTMNLWTMHDLGGCRIVVPMIEDVYKVVNKYQQSRIRHIPKRDYDYIAFPQKTGYRCYHMVYQYQSDSKDTYNRNMLIEIQVRSHLQHLWATALETVGLFTNQALKANHGEEDTLRFFALISSVFAKKENGTTIPGTPDNYIETIEEIENLEKKHNYLSMLSGIRVAVDKLDEKKDAQQGGYYILILNYTTRRLRFKFYMLSQIEEATKDYEMIESTRAENKIDAVLVSVSSFNALKMAYPNYFSDIGEFINEVKSVI